MARKPKAETERKGGAVRGNGFDPVVAKRWQGEYDKLDERLLELQMDYMAECKAVRSDMKDVLERAKDAGIPKKAIKTTAKIRDYERKISKLESAGEPEDVETLEQFRHALGDLAETELGQYAIKAKAVGMPGADAAASM